MERNLSRSPLDPSVLIVDDDPDFRTLVRAYLANQPYSLTEAPDGAVALERIDQNHFDLIVLDIVMPERDGFELIPAIRKSSPKSRILAVSGSCCRSIYLKMADHMGVDLALEKPVGRDRFSCCVRQLLAPPSLYESC